MRTGAIGGSLLVTLIVVATAKAEDSDLAQGQKLYGSECMVCHGDNSSSQTSYRTPVPSPWHFVHVAMRQPAGSTMADVPDRMTSAWGAATQTGLAAQGAAQGDRLAVALPYGPNLRGIHGRAAGSAEGFQYSEPFLKALQGMEWTEAALDVWITNTQRWVPGVIMYYRQPDAEIRRKIILYLKANP